MIDKAIEWLQEKHPWLSYAEAFALIVYAWEEYEPHNKYCGMAPTLLRMHIDILGRETEDYVRNRLSVVQEWL